MSLRQHGALRVMSLAVTLGLFTSPPLTAQADNVVADDQIVQGNLCVGIPCADGEALSGGGEIRIKGESPRLRFERTEPPLDIWHFLASEESFSLIYVNTFDAPFRVEANAPGGSLMIQADGKVGVGEYFPSQKLHVRQDQNANTFLLVQNATDDPSAAAVIRTQADTAFQNFESHASSRTLVRWGVPLGGWNEFLSVVGNGLAMGTFNPTPFILGTAATPRMTFDGLSNVIDFAGGGQYNGASFLDASSRTRKQEIRLLAPVAAAEALAGLEPVTFAYRDAPGDARVGFIAEDVPELVATPDRQTLSALEIVAVLTKVVQDQQKAIAELKARLGALEARP